jgi:glycosyltransferase involved in cell wall biosynthesis
MSHQTSEVLLYISRVDLAERTGQASFERGLIEALLRIPCLDTLRDVRVLTVASQPVGTLLDARVVTIPLANRRFLDYAKHQARLLIAIVRTLRELRDRQVVLFVRFSPTMVAPLFLSWVLRRRLVFRTGPVIPSVRAYRPETRSWVLGALAILTGLYAWKAQRIVVATHAIAAWVERAYPFARSKIVVVSNGANLARLPSAPRDRQRWRLPEAGFVIGYVGSLIREQGLDTVLRAMAKLPALSTRPRLLVVGDGPLLEEWRSLARDLGVSQNVTWAGSVPHAEVASGIAACDVMVMPLTGETIRTRGTSATKLFEYLASDRFVLASRCPDLEFLEEHGLGRLVEPDNPDAWAAAVLEEKDVKRALGGEGRALVAREYSYDAVAGRIWASCFESPAESQWAAPGVS